MLLFTQTKQTNTTMASKHKTTLLQQQLKIQTGNGVNLEEWARFVEACFSEKQPPPTAAYFLSKVHNVPTFDLDRDVRVMMDEADGGRIVATLRLFRGRFIVSSEVDDVETIGIGEVCVRPDRRGQGIGEFLVEESVRMERNSTNRSPVFTLHATLPNARRLYERCGFKRCAAEIVYIQFSVNSALVQEDQCDNPYLPRLCNTSDSADLERLATLYEQDPVVGTMRRSYVYWQSWIRCKWERRQGLAILVSDHSKIVGYIYAYGTIPGRLRLDEICISSDLSTRERQSVFISAIRMLLATVKCTEFVASKTLIHRALGNLEGPTLQNIEVAFSDDGWMFSDVSQEVICVLGQSGVFYDSDTF